MPLLFLEEKPREGLEAQIERIGVGHRQQILGIDVARVEESAINKKPEEVALEGRVVGDQGATGEDARDLPGYVGDGGSVGEVGVGQAREPLDDNGEGTLGTHQAVDGANRGAAGIEQDDTDLDDLGVPVVHEPRRLEVDHGERTGRLEERLDGVRCNSERFGVMPLRTQQTRSIGAVSIARCRYT